MFKYAYHHGVKTIALENPNVLGRLRFLWIRSGKRGHKNYNYKVALFRNLIIGRIAMKNITLWYGGEIRRPKRHNIFKRA